MRSYKLTLKQDEITFTFFAKNKTSDEFIEFANNVESVIHRTVLTDQKLKELQSKAKDWVNNAHKQKGSSQNKLLLSNLCHTLITTKQAPLTLSMDEYEILKQLTPF